MLSVPRARHAFFFTSPRATEPLNANSFARVVTAGVATHLPGAPPLSDLLLRRSPHSRVLVFPRSAWDRPTSVPVASLLVPPLLPLPVVRLPLWDGAPSPRADEAPVSLDELLATAHAARHRAGADEDESAVDDASHGSALPVTQPAAAANDLVGVLCVTANQLSFVVTDCARNVIAGPVVALFVSSHALADAPIGVPATSFFGSFWRRVACDPAVAAATARCAVLYFRCEGDAAPRFYGECCPAAAADADCGERAALAAMTQLRDDPRWLRLPASSAKGKKAKHDTDSLLRDLNVGGAHFY